MTKKERNVEILEKYLFFNIKSIQKYNKALSITEKKCKSIKTKKKIWDRKLQVFFLRG